MFYVQLEGIFAAMFRVVTAIALIILLFSNAFLKSAVLLDFKINQDFISQTFCVQKAEKENTCNGKCHLSKQLEKAENDSEDAPISTENLQEILLYFSFEDEFLSFRSESSSLQSPAFNKLNGIGSIHSIFHPPQFV